MTILGDQMGLATRLARSGERDRAQFLFSQIVEVDPQNVQAWLWLSELTDQLEEQTAMLEQALKYIPAGADGHKDLQAQINEIHGFAALSAPAQPLPRQKLDHQAVYQRVERLAINGKQAEAFEMVKELTEDGPVEERVWLLYSELCPQLEGKIAALEKAAEINPGSALTTNRLKVFRQTLDDPLEAGQYLEACGEYDQALGLYQTVARQSASPDEQAEARSCLLRLERHPLYNGPARAPQGIRKLLTRLARFAQSRMLSGV